MDEKALRAVALVLCSSVVAGHHEEAMEAADFIGVRLLEDEREFLGDVLTAVVEQVGKKGT